MSSESTRQRTDGEVGTENGKETNVGDGSVTHLPRTSVVTVRRDRDKPNVGEGPDGRVVNN